MKSWLINKTVLYFEEIFFVDPVNGLDTNDGMTPETAFKTILKYTQQPIENSACVLADGEYPTTTFHNSTNYTRTYIGNGHKTRVIVGSDLNFAGKNTYTDFIRCLFVPSGNVNYAWGAYNSSMPVYSRHYNCVYLRNGKTVSYAFMSHHYSSEVAVKKYMEFHNCAMEGGGSAGFHSYRQYAAYAFEMTNCAVPIAADITGAHIAVNKTNIVSAIDQTTIFPTVQAWQHTGTGENPDGTQAHIGVYGGDFAWAPNMFISGGDENIGLKTDPPVYDYMVDDALAGTTLSITEKVNDVVIRKIYGAERNREYTLEVPIMEFWQLGGNDSAISVTVENGIGEYTRTITFARDIKKVDIKLLPTVTTTRVAKLTPTVSYTGQATSVQILVSNNALDENPAWEEATAGTQHIFANSTKTDENWAVAMRVTVEGEEGEHIALSPPSFAYST